MRYLRAPTHRQLQCLANALILGRAQAAIALGISEATLRNHLTDLYERLDVDGEGRSVTMARAAFAVGWLDIPQDLIESPWRPGRIADDDSAVADQLLRYAQAIVDELSTG